MAATPHRDSQSAWELVPGAQDVTLCIGVKRTGRLLDSDTSRTSTRRCYGCNYNNTADEELSYLLRARLWRCKTCALRTFLTPTFS